MILPIVMMTAMIRTMTLRMTMTLTMMMMVTPINLVKTDPSSL